MHHEIKLTVRRRAHPDDDILVSADAHASVAELIAQLDADISSKTKLGDGQVTLRIDEPGPSRTVPPTVSLTEAGLQSGQTVTLVDISGRFADPDERGPQAATLTVVSGPGAPCDFPLPFGSTQLGRGSTNDISLTDPLVSKQHARINVTERMEIIDLGASNGVLVNDERVNRAVLGPDDRVLLGDTVLSVTRHRANPGVPLAGSAQFNRSPHVEPRYEGLELAAPAPPERMARQRIPMIAMFVPVLMGVVLYLVTQQLATVAFVALTPLMMLGNVVESRIGGRKDHEQAVAEFRDELAELADTITAEHERERASRQREHPSLRELVDAAAERQTLLWFRRPDRVGFLELRLGLGTLASRTKVPLPHVGRSSRDLLTELHVAVDSAAEVDDVPVVGSLKTAGAIGVTGPSTVRLAHARGLLCQLAIAHSPADVVLTSIMSSTAARDWDWLKWLPHVTSEHSPLAVGHLAAGPGGALPLTSALEELVEHRLAGDGTTDGASVESELPAIVLLVDDDLPVERSRIVELAERGIRAGLFVLWLAPNPDQLPSTCSLYTVPTGDEPSGEVTVRTIDGGASFTGVRPEPLTADEALAVARSLSPVIDASHAPDEQVDLPTSVSFLSHLGPELGADPQEIIERWRQSGSLPVDATADLVAPTRSSHGLQAFIGVTATGPVSVDLRAHGPHALVGGTTGAGKSELLQTWIAGMAVNHSPARVNFLFVDYKGGAAFGECVQLPHSVGLVTDLTSHLVRRVLQSLNAEVQLRESLLHRKKAKDVLELERVHDPDTPASLVIVVDEFATLVKEVPEFIDGVVNVAQRGRSLGLHLVLATQRPAGVIRDNLRANTNLRIALRMADREDSEDVVGNAVAATFDPELPGRAIAKLGPGRLTTFQTAYVGGWTTGDEEPARIDVTTLGFGGVSPLNVRDPVPAKRPAATGPNDLQRIVATARRAAQALRIGPPRRPWLDELAPVYDLARTPQSRNDEELVFGIRDEPDLQSQSPVSFQPDRDGNMAVFGTSGSGKSVFLRTLAVVAGLSVRGSPCHVYGLDFGTRGLHMLEVLPHVGSIIGGDDRERTMRLIRWLRATIDDRSARYSTVRAGSITEYRRLSGEHDEARILLLVDGVGTFRQAYETGIDTAIFDQFQAIAADGRPVGVHVVVSADRHSAVPVALASSLQRRLVLRLAGDTDYALLGAPTDGFTMATPPGRGFIDEHEIQVAVLGGTANTALQSTQLTKLADEMRRSMGRSQAPPIERLTERVSLGELPATVGGQPVFGVGYDALEPVGFDPSGVFVITGPAQSGKSTAMATIASSLRRTGAVRGLVYLGSGLSPLRSAVPWTAAADTLDGVEALAKELIQDLGASPPGDDGPAPWAVFIDDAPGFLSSSADLKLQDLIKECRDHRCPVYADGDTSSMASSWPLLQALKAGRHGLAFAPDQIDGDTVFRTPFPRTTRLEFPPGRAFYVRQGRVARVQVALPDSGS